MHRPTEDCPGYTEIGPHELVRERFTRIVDVREPHEFIGELGHLSSAQLVPLATLARTAASWNKDEAIAVVCRSGARSARGAAELVALGFTAVTNLRGGMLAVRAAERSGVAA